MKKLLFSSLITILVITAIFAQPSLQWASRFNGPVASDKGKTMTIDASGNVFVTGSSDGFGAGPDFLTIKYNSSGDTLWTKRYNGSGNGEDVAVAIKVDNSGNVYVTGKSQGSGTGYDIVTIKYNSSGVQQWVSVFNGGANIDDIGYDLAIDVSGNTFVVGSSYYLFGNTNTDGVVIKYSPSGLKLWDININELSNTNEIANLVAINNFNNIVVTDGIFYPNSLVYRVLELNPSNGSVVQKYNIQSNFDAVIGIPNAMVLDGVGNMYITSTSTFFPNPYEVHTAKFTHGIQERSWDSWTYVSNDNQSITGVDMKIDVNLNVYVLSDLYNGNHKYHIKKYNPSGSVAWTMQYNPSIGIDDIPVSLALNNSSNPEVFVTGYTSIGNIITVGYSNSGNQLWNPVIYDCGNSGIDVASAMVMDNCNNLYVTGYSSCNGTNDDVKTIKYSSSVPPTISAIGSTTICQNGSVTLNTNACAGCTYLWSSGQTTQNIIVSPLVTTNYTVTVTNFGCSTASLPTTITVNPASVPSVSIATQPTLICSGQDVTFTATSINSGAAPIYQWYANNTPVGANSPTYSTTTLTNGTQVYCTMTSNATCANPAMVTSNSLTITVTPSPVPGLSVVAQPTVTCSGQNVMFTATPTNSGTSPTYQWYVNGNPVGPNSPTYSTTTLPNGAQVYCAMTSNAVCANPAMVTSNSLAITVNTLAVPGVNVIASSTSICPGQNVTFTATPSNGGASPTYQWYVNGSPIGSNSPMYSTTTLTNGSQVYCIMTSNAMCVNPATATSNTLSIAVNQTIVPDVSIATPFTSICSEQNVTFTVTPINGGASPNYQWFVNGSPIGSSPPVNLTNGSQVYCTMTSTLVCANPSVATSNVIAFTVNPSVAAGVSITTPFTVTCLGQNVTFTATPINGGTMPIYQWYVNENPVGNNSSTYSTTMLTNGSQVRCAMTSNAICANPATASSNLLTMTLNPIIAASLNINATPTSICSGQNVTFSAISINGGSSPTFQWYVNGIPVGSNSPTYSTSTLTNGSQIHCTMNSSAACASPITALSNSLAINVSPSLVPSVSVNIVGGQNAICPGQNATFNATPTNGGTSPSYQWYVNGIPVGNNSPTYSTPLLTNGAQVYCTMTSNASCVNPVTASSSVLNMVVTPLPQPNLIISNDTIYAPNFTGGEYSYSWYFNGSSSSISTEYYIICQTLVSGSYELVVNFNGCTTSNSINVVNCIVGTRDNNHISHITVFPNPTSEFFNIEGDKLKSGYYTIKLCNILGQTLLEETLLLSTPSFRTQLNVEDATNGHYYISIYSESERHVFLVQKFK